MDYNPLFERTAADVKIHLIDRYRTTSIEMSLFMTRFKFRLSSIPSANMMVVDSGICFQLSISKWLEGLAVEDWIPQELSLSWYEC